MNNVELLHTAVVNYLRNFIRVEIDGDKKVKYILTNALRISFGRSFDHTEYCVWLANNTPGYGVIAKSQKTIDVLKNRHRARKHAKTEISTAQIKLAPADLDINTQVLIIMNASYFSQVRLVTIARSWFTERPMLMIG